MSIVAAKTDGWITLFAVPKDAKGVTADPRRLVDSSLASHFVLDGVEVDADAVIGEVDAGGDILDALLAAPRTGAAPQKGGVGPRYARRREGKGGVGRCKSRWVQCR